MFMRARISPDLDIQEIGYGEVLDLHGVRVSLHPAGHILGSAQIRVEAGGEVWVITGDYKTEPDRTCAPFELVACHALITETTFGLPIYRWEPSAKVFSEINAWWAANQQAERASVLLTYALGKAQRLLAGLDPQLGTPWVHGSVDVMNRVSREAGLDLPDWQWVNAKPKGLDTKRCLVLAPPSALGSAWMRRFGDASLAFASGWMSVRGAQKRRAVDRGFALSDHVDWPALLGVVQASGAERIYTTHGYAPVVSRYLREEMGLWSEPLETLFGEEPEEVESGHSDQKSEEAQ